MEIVGAGGKLCSAYIMSVRSTHAIFGTACHSSCSCSASVVEALREIAGAGGNRAALLGAARRAASGLLALRAAAGPPAITSALRKVGALV